MAQCMRDFHPHLAPNGVASHRGDTQFAHDIDLAEIEASIYKTEQSKVKPLKLCQNNCCIQLLHLPGPIEEKANAYVKQIPRRVFRVLPIVYEKCCNHK